MLSRTTISGAAWRPDDQVLDAVTRRLGDIGNDALVPLPSAEPIELIAADTLDPHALRLRQPHDLGEPIVGARRDANQCRALRLERFHHRVDAVDQQALELS